MVLKTIVFARHGARTKFGDSKIQPTRDKITMRREFEDDPLTALGIEQAKELADHLVETYPDIGMVYTSGSYRCLQTLKLYIDKLESLNRKVKVFYDPAFGEWRKINKQHTRAPDLWQMQTLIPTIMQAESLCTPFAHENPEEIYARLAYSLARLVQALDEDPTTPETVLICTHGGPIIGSTRVLLNCIPADYRVNDFPSAAIGVCAFSRQDIKPVEIDENKKTELGYTEIDIRKGNSIGGRWTIEKKNDCSFLSTREIMISRFSVEPTPILTPEQAHAANSPCYPNFFGREEMLEWKLASEKKEVVIAVTLVTDTLVA